MFPAAVGGDTPSVSSGTFTDENVTLKNPPGPSGLNLSEVPWLQAFFRYYESGNPDSGTSGETGTQRGNTDILRLLLSISIILGVGILGAVILWFMLFRSEPESDESSVSHSQQLPAEDESTGQTASEPGVSPSNGVYRGWYEMIDHLRVSDWRSRTPGELARLATDSGLNQNAVATITRQFEWVRYGDATPTPDREAEVSDALDQLMEEGDT